MGSGDWICSWVFEQILEEEESPVALNFVQMPGALERVAPPHVEHRHSFGSIKKRSNFLVG
jgi:hypothetical protein